jgi:hypothetical protein
VNVVNLPHDLFSPLNRSSNHGIGSGAALRSTEQNHPPCSGDAPRGFLPQSPARACGLPPSLLAYHIRVLFAISFGIQLQVRYRSRMFNSFTTEKAQAIYKATKHLQFGDFAAIDVKDRLALATVAAGLRPIGVLEGEGVQLERIRDVLVDQGFHTLVSKSVWSRKERQLDGYPLLRLLDEMWTPTKGQRVLWFCANSDDRRQLKAHLLTKKDAGILLGYPSCCVEFELEIDTKFDVAFLNALIAKVGSDEQSLRRALKEDVGVEIPDDIPKLKNISRTDAQFPFVMHIACDACLGSETSPSTRINVSYEALAQHIDPAFHALMLQVRTLCANLRLASDDKTNDEIRGQIEQLHRTAYPSIRRK